METKQVEIPDFVLKEVEILRESLEETLKGTVPIANRYQVANGCAVKPVGGNIIMVLPSGATWAACHPKDAMEIASRLIHSAISCAPSGEKAVDLAMQLSKSIEQLILEIPRSDKTQH